MQEMRGQRKRGQSQQPKKDSIKHFCYFNLCPGIATAYNRGMIKAVIFDCFGVLTADAWVEFCKSLPAGEVVDSSRKLNHQYDAGKIGLEEFLSQVTKITGRDRLELERIFNHPSRAKNQELFEYIKELKPKYKIGMLSNIATNWVRESFLSHEEQELFDAMAFSYEIGATKPEPLTYETITKMLDVSFSESVFIDDQPRYCEAAGELGMQAIWYQEFGQMKKDLEAILSSVADN
jgi:HAD superfamily hydrolase (TIGR01509 family)